MASLNILDIAGTAMTAQSLRLNATASNLANAESVSGDENSVYRAKHPVFEQILDEKMNVAGVRVAGVMESRVPASKLYEPGNPLANNEGYVFKSNVNVLEEMADMISASRSYQNNVEVMNTVKQIMMNTLKLGQ